MRAALVALLVVASLAVPAAAAPGSVAEPRPSVADVEVTPDPVLEGESVTIAPTIANDESATGTFNLTSVALRTTDGDRLRPHTNITNLGTLSPGASVRVPFEVEFEAAGQKRLRVVALGENETGARKRVEYPVSFRVRDDHPDVRVATDDTVTAGVDEPLNVTVSNGFERELRGVRVEVIGDGLDVDPVTAGTATLAAGDERTFAFDVRGSDPGTRAVEVVVRYRTTTGLERETTDRYELSFDPLREDVSIDAGVPAAGETTVPVTVGNFGNAPIENVVVRAEASNGSVSPVAVGTLAAGTTERVELTVDGVETRADLRVFATYESTGETKRVETTSRVRAQPAGEIELTGLDVEREGGRLHVVGSAANVGLDEVNSVVVRVRATEQVEPAPPNREYFVGTVPASDFVSFDVYATVDGNVSEIPLEVTYLAGGERRTVDATVPYEGPTEPREPTTDGGGSGPLVYVVGAVAALLVVALVVVGWRRRGE